MNVGIYTTVFPVYSHMFINEQISNLKRYKPLVILRTKLEETDFPNVSISEGDFYSIKQKLFALTRNTCFFGLKKELSNLNLIHAHFGPDGTYAMALANKLNIPFLVTYHGLEVTFSRKAMCLTFKPNIYHFILHERELMEKATFFIAVSRFIEKKIIEKGYPKQKIIQHYIGVDTEKFVPSVNNAANRYIFCVGRHTERKGIDTLLIAFSRVCKKHSDVSLIQAGKGPESENLKKLAQSLGIGNRVHFLGALPHKRIVNLMRNAEIFALTCQRAKDGDMESLGIVFNEASACGIPVVSTLHGGISEAVLHGKTGLLSEEKDYKAIAENLDILLNDKPLARQMGMNGRDFTCEMFDIRKQTRKLETIYDRVVNA